MHRYLTWSLAGGAACLTALGIAQCNTYDFQHQGVEYPPLPPAPQLPAPRPMHFAALPVAAYRLTDLGESVLPDAGDTVALNNAGEVALTIGRKAYVWHKGRLVKLPVRHDGAVNALNDRGQCVGGDDEQNVGAITSDDSDAILWEHGRTKSLGTLPGLSDAEAKGINERGQVIGTSAPDSEREVIDADERNHTSGDPPLDRMHSFLWQNGRMTDIGAARAVALNDIGQVVGQIVTTDGSYAALWKGGKWRSLGTLPGWQESAATGINSHGAVVGDASSGVSSEAFVWQSGRMRDLGRGHAGGINAAGQIVGSSGGRAVLWWRGKEWDLNACLRGQAGWTLTSASGINDRGQIVGLGKEQGQGRFFLLTPQH